MASTCQARISEFGAADSQERKKKRKRNGQKCNDREKLWRKLRLGIKSPVPHSVSAATATESHVKNYTAAPANRQLQRGVHE